MRLLDLTLPTPQENLALDEALVDEAEASSAPGEWLRLWESQQPFVVVGRGSQVAREVNVDFCRDRGIPILRRASGGAAVVAAPGSLMYAVVLNYEARPALRSLDEAHRFVLGTIVESLKAFAPRVACQGTSDLTLGPLKFSGNSVRVKRRNLLYHGTLLYDLDLALVDRCLSMPPRQPEYRQGRPHRSFVTNLPIGRQQLCDALIDGWQARATDDDWPRQRTQDLVATRYSQADWNEEQ